MVEQVQAMVRTGPSKLELREYPMPDIAEDAALLKMEVAGICGTDVKLYKTPPNNAPTIMGHENIGYIAKAGREFTRRKGFKEGDLVFVEHYVMCGKCKWCHHGQYRHCENTDWRNNPDGIRYGYTSAEKAPHLWGGFAQYVYLPWNAVRASRAEGRDAGAGRAGDADGQRRRVVAVRRRRRLQFDRADPGAGPAGPVADGDLQAGRRVADHRHRHFEGCRPARGREAARRGLRHRRAEGRSARAHHGDHRRQGRRHLAGLHGRARARFPILLGIEALTRKAGVIVVQGEMKEFPNFPLEKMTVKAITIKSARGHSYRACELALEQIASNRFDLEKITTHRFGLKDADLAIRSVGGQGLPDVIHASLMPWM